MSGWGLIALRYVAAVGAAATVLLLPPPPAFAQTRSLAPPQSAAPAPLFSGPGLPGASMVTPTPLAATPLAPTPMAPMVGSPAPMVPAGRVALAVGARFGRDAPPIPGGLIWRVYDAKP